ncbi:MAG TPA: multicopper oxidase domain-containing protein, partial [Gemmatimonadales bacterium]|nr:multicopper oxidase domain-containing protein [Gemmatimonadales bacterium]
VSDRLRPGFVILGVLAVLAVTCPPAGRAADRPTGRWQEPPIPCASERAVTLGRDLDGDGDPDEIDIHLEVDEIQEEVYPGQFETFWVFAPEGKGMCSPARVPSPTIRVEVGDHVRIHLHNTHYLPHTIHFHGTIHPNAMDGVPDFTQAPVRPGETFTYEFVARQPGTFWYHCHVQTDVHVLMGLAGMFIVEPNRPRNNFRHLIVGAGRISDLAKAEIEEGYGREYSLVYMDIDDRLNQIPASNTNPAEVERRMHRDYDTTQRRPNIFLLNGRSFPFTLRDTPIDVRPGERVKLRVLNAGARTIALHTHGHHPIITALDGYPIPPAQRVARDVFTLLPAQRVDLELRPGNDGRYASGPGVWLVHDHTEQAVTNNGINPGGDLTAIVYEGFRAADGLPRVATSLKRFFDPNYYRGKIPVFDPSIFHAQAATTDPPAADPRPDAGAGGEAPYPTRREPAPPRADDAMAEHRIVATSCRTPRTFQRLTVKEGTRQAQPGEVYGFEPRVLHVERCQEVELVLQNTDSIRHALMIPGLNPMFMLEFPGPATERARFVTPDRDITLPFHCHVATHEEMGMHGEIVVGLGGPPTLEPEVANHLHEGLGVVISIDARKSRLVVDHEEIPGFMAAMTMNYLVNPASLLQGLIPGDKIRFTIDEDQRAIVRVAPLRR